MKFIIAIIVFMFSFNTMAANKAPLVEKPISFILMEENQIPFFTNTVKLLTSKCIKMTLAELRAQTVRDEDDRVIYAYKCEGKFWYEITKNSK